MSLEYKILEIIRGEKKAPFIKAGLIALGGVYRSLVAMRNWAYDRGIYRSRSLTVPVVSIGNIAVGGTGKTPLVHLLVSALQKKINVAILTRGYRSRLEKKGTFKQISEGKGAVCSAEECGDEPYFLAQKTEASVWVGADRYASGQKAIEAGAQCLILDDGMQHRRVKRDFEIVTVDAADPFAQDRFLPGGLLRDSPQRLKHADLIVLTHLKDQKQYKKLKQELVRFTTAPIVGMQLQVVNTSMFSARKVGVFCGIGQPARFLETVRDLNQEIVDTFLVKDHGCLTERELQTFAKRCRARGAEMLLCTEKDYVKLSPKWKPVLPIIPVEIEWKVSAGKKHWDELVKNILDRVAT